MQRRRITVIGAGNVGEHVAFGILLRELGDVVLVDIVKGMPQGKALDMMQATPALFQDIKISGTNDYKETAGSDVIVITSGFPRKPGMDRSQLLKKNAEIVADVTRNAVKYSPDAIIIMVTNPLDVMSYVAYKVSGFPRERVIGMAGVLDTSRFRTFAAEKLNVSVRDINAIVLGGHGDSMVPLVRYTTVAGAPITKLLSKQELQSLIKRTQKGGGEIVSLLKKGSAYYAPAMSVVQMVNSILKDKNQIMPCSVMTNGEYGYEGVYVGLPAKLGANGLVEIVDFDLSFYEKDALDRSAERVRNLQKEVDGLGIFDEKVKQKE